jgi:hypothetical protein
MQSDDIEKRKKCATSELVELVIVDSDEIYCDNVGKTQTERESSPDVDDEIIFVPNNPRTWTEKHIETWINWATKKFNLAPALDASRIPKNSEDLAKFTKAEFYIACGSFEGGKMLSQHYKYMMENVKESCDETLLKDGDPG